MSMDAARLGAAMYSAVHALESGSTKDDVTSRFEAMAQAIIDEIKDNATIATLSTTSTPSGTGPHIHSPATVSATGKIS